MRIAAARPHALIYPEIGMDPMVAQLAALRLAPVQYASWGHPDTSGYPTIDFYLSSAAMEPRDGDDHYTEQLVRLPGLSTPMEVAQFAGKARSHASLGLPEEATIFWCGQSLHKYLPRHDDVFPLIAARVPDARFVFVEFPGSPSLSARFRERLTAAFRRHGQDASAVHVLPRMTAADFRAAMGCADVVLDSIGWSGCNTLLDALSHALPIVTLRGTTMRGSHGAAMLRAVGLKRFVAGDLAAYVEIAAGLARDSSAREEFRAALVAANWRLEGHDPVTALERHIAAACIASGAGPGSRT